MSVRQNGSESGGDGVETECRNCEYVWCYSGTRWYTTCPNCNRKTPTPYAEEAKNND